MYKVGQKVMRCGEPDSTGELRAPYVTGVWEVFVEPVGHIERWHERYFEPAAEPGCVPPGKPVAAEPAALPLDVELAKAKALAVYWKDAFDAGVKTHQEEMRQLFNRRGDIEGERDTLRAHVQRLERSLDLAQARLGKRR
jgi:hypothetical protein